MKFNKSSQLLLVSAASLLAASLIAACGSLTVDFVFVTSSKAAGSYNYGEIDVFEINSESGFMRQIPTSPFPSGGRDPVAEAVSSDYTNLYVVNQLDNTIVQFIIGNDGKLYPQNTVNTPGTYPLAVAVNSSNLFVLDTYQPLANCSVAEPCSGAIAVFPVESTSTPAGALGSVVSNGSLTYWPLNLTGAKASDVLLPTGINVLASGSEVYVSAYDSTANAGYVFGFTVGSGGVLTAVSGSPWATGAGTDPSAITSYTSGSSNYVYVTDGASGDVLSYAVASSTGVLTSLGAISSGNGTSAIVADPSYPYLYAANATDGTVAAFSIASGGELSKLGTFAAGVDPVAIGIDPSTNHFLFTANYLGSNISGLEIVTSGSSAGTLVDSQGTPYTSNAQPTAVAAVPHNGSKN